MAANDDPYGPLLDQLIASHFTLRAFMLEISVELARSKERPEAWATNFIASLHSRIDANEAYVGEMAMTLPSHEMARQNVDSLGKDLHAILRLPPS